MYWSTLSHPAQSAAELYRLRLPLWSQPEKLLAKKVLSNCLFYQLMQDDMKCFSTLSSAHKVLSKSSKGGPLLRLLLNQTPKVFWKQMILYILAALPEQTCSFAMATKKKRVTNMCPLHCIVLNMVVSLIYQSLIINVGHLFTSNNFEEFVRIGTYQLFGR